MALGQGKRVVLALIAIAVLGTGIAPAATASNAALEHTSISSNAGETGHPLFAVAQLAEDEAQTPADEVQIPEDEIPKNPVPLVEARPSSTTSQVSFKTPWEIYLAGFTVVLGIGFIALFCFAFRRSTLDHTFSRNFIILTVIFSALFLIVAGYSERQTAPVFGILGTIIGYLFGVTTGKAQASAEIERAQRHADAAQGTSPTREKDR